MATYSIVNAEGMVTGKFTDSGDYVEAPEGGIILAADLPVGQRYEPVAGILFPEAFTAIGYPADDPPADDPPADDPPADDPPADDPPADDPPADDPSADDPPSGV